jgi:hypothetical protein
MTYANAPPSHGEADECIRDIGGVHDAIHGAGLNGCLRHVRYDGSFRRLHQYGSTARFDRGHAAYSISHRSA